MLGRAALLMFGGCGVLLVACGPSSSTLRSLSSADVPCGQSEIGVYDRTTHQGVDEWTAACKGQLFTCTRTRGSGDAECKPLGAQSDNVATAAPARSTRVPHAVAPAGAAGFSFGTSLEDAQRTCESAGYGWSPAGNEWACSAAPVSVGFDAVVHVRACSGQVCAISLVHRPQEDWPAFIGETKDRLVAKYGAPTESEDLVPRLCSPPQEFAACVERGELKLRFAWAWPSGERVALVVGKFGGEAGTVRLDYGRIRSAL